jgi:hypothetical protein
MKRRELFTEENQYIETWYKHIDDGEYHHYYLTAFKLYIDGKLVGDNKIEKK